MNSATMAVLLFIAYFFFPLHGSIAWINNITLLLALLNTYFAITR